MHACIYTCTYGEGLDQAIDRAYVYPLQARPLSQRRQLRHKVQRVRAQAELPQRALARAPVAVLAQRQRQVLHPDSHTNHAKTHVIRIHAMRAEGFVGPFRTSSRVALPCSFSSSSCSTAAWKATSCCRARQTVAGTPSAASASGVFAHPTCRVAVPSESFPVRHTHARTHTQKPKKSGSMHCAVRVAYGVCCAYPALTLALPYLSGSGVLRRSSHSLAESGPE
eukprot:COSAG05_NODE_1309_length_5222_cov_9.690611_5_plen_224_part_00